MKHYPQLTAKPREGPSLPTKWLWERNYLKGEVLDFGSGYGADGAFLRNHGFAVTDYDPYYTPAYPTGYFDTIICQYVLNVLEPLEQSQVIMQVSELLKPTGTAYFAVRRDISQRNKGVRIHKEYQEPTYQTPVRLPFPSVMQNAYCEIYAHQPFRQLPNGDPDCPFCQLAPDQQVITESTTAFAIFDKYPVNQGHMLIIPKKHEANYFNLTLHKQQGLNVVMNRCRNLLDNWYHPDGYNTGINVGQTAGQTVSHVHLHLIPRYEGDMPDPTGGVRHVIPEKGNYKA